MLEFSAETHSKNLMPIEMFVIEILVIYQGKVKFTPVLRGAKPSSKFQKKSLSSFELSIPDWQQLSRVSRRGHISPQP